MLFLTVRETAALFGCSTLLCGFAFLTVDAGPTPLNLGYWEGYSIGRHCLQRLLQARAFFERKSAELQSMSSPLVHRLKLRVVYSE